MKLKWDTFVWKVATQILRLASKEYQDWLSVIHVLGRRELGRILEKSNE